MMKKHTILLVLLLCSCAAGDTENNSGEPTAKKEEPVAASCSDGIQNQAESNVDCGGPCVPCEPSTPDDMGERCDMECSNLPCAREHASCEATCVRARDSAFSHGFCSRSCEASCPEGWACLPMMFTSIENACVALLAVCGDGIVGIGEACDDGNQSGRDLCSFDCSKVTELPSSGTVTVQIDANQVLSPPVIVSGTEESGEEQEVRAVYRSGTLGPYISFRWKHPDTNGWLYLNGIDEGPNGIMLGVEDSIPGTGCFYVARNSALITSYDPDNQRVIGSGYVVASCSGSDFGCSIGTCPENIEYQVEFDLNWREGPMR